MKRLKIASLCALCALILGSCRGQSDDGVEVQLLPSTTTIVANGKDVTTFQVLYGANDVSAEAEIALISHPELGWSGNKFSTTEAGEYVFSASYRGMTSEEVKIVAEEPVVIISRFERHLCVMDLTGAWCTFCPEGFRKLNYYCTKAAWKGVVHLLALHDNTQGDDPMGLPLTSEIMSEFGNYGFPMFVTDLRDSGSLTANLADIEPSFYRSVEEYPACSDVKIATSLNDRLLSVDVTLFAEAAGEWSVNVFLVEDGIISPQKDGSIISEEYIHNHVARALLNSNWRGDRLGRLSADQESSKSYTITLEEEWVADNMYVMALAMDSEGYVNNVAVCPLGESVEYKYLSK